MSREVKVYKSKRKAATMLLISVVVLIIGVLLVLNTDKQVAGWSIIILSGLGLLLGLSTLLDRMPLISVDETGIADRTQKNETIEWNAIHDANPFHFRGQYYLRIIVDKDYKPSLIGNRFYRLDRFNDKAGIKALYLKMSLLDADPANLVMFIRAMAHSEPEQRRRLMNEVPGFQK